VPARYAVIVPQGPHLILHFIAVGLLTVMVSHLDPWVAAGVLFGIGILVNVLVWAIRERRIKRAADGGGGDGGNGGGGGGRGAVGSRECTDCGLGLPSSAAACPRCGWPR
jgi:hypothetical protein